MKRTLRICLVMLVLLLAGRYTAAYAQEYQDVQIMVYNTADENKLFDEVMIYIYETEAEGRKAAKLWEDAKRAAKETGVSSFDPSQASSDAAQKDLRGTSWPAILKDVSATGAVLITTELGGYPYKLEMVKGRRELKVSLRVEQVEMLDAATKKADLAPRLPLTPPVDKGDTIYIKKGYLFPKPHMGRTDARFAMQSFILPPGGGNDTLEFRTTVIMDGRNYHATQLRRMGYVGERDPLYAIADDCPALTDSTDRAYITDKIVKGRRTKGGLIMAKIWFEDYNHVYFTDEWEVEDMRRLVRPMQFLEYSLETSSLNPQDPLYRKEPRVVKMDAELDLSINFAVGKAHIDPSDEASLHMLDSLKSIVYAVTHTAGSEMRGYRISGVASPEGVYAKNAALAGERMHFIKRQVDAEIPASATIHFKSAPEANARVATWAELADTLAQDSTMLSYAQDIREIVERYPHSIDAQGAKIRQLPYYSTVIKDNLSRLRRVSFYYSQSVHRAMTVEEMFDKLRNDPTFMKGGASEQFMPYEFWVMLQHVKDTTELEQLCRRAIDQDKRMQSRKEFRWPLPANMLAASYLERGKVDTTILAPFIFEEFQHCNQPWNLGENRALLNPTAVVANQVAMMLKAEHYTRAMQLALLFKDSDDPQLEKLYAIARCKAGYFDSDTDEGRKYYDIVRSTSPRNALVMDIATGYLGEAEETLEQMNQEDPVTDYMRAQLVCVQHFQETNDNTFNLMSEEDQHRAIRALVACFNKDAKYLETADSDWYIFKGLYENAVKEYKEPGSVLPSEEEEAAAAAAESAAQELTEEQKNELIMKAMNHPEEMTDEEWALYDKISGF